ncbi:hypothetical protein BN133_4021 [Cronobacter dublinensis 582]|nr:hypothetical protein BN133_4021 [Cronobacter dublinensis 582]
MPQAIATQRAPDVGLLRNQGKRSVKQRDLAKKMRKTSSAMHL